MISDSALSQLKADNPCAKVASRWVRLRKHGNGMIGPCPICSRNRQSKSDGRFEIKDRDRWVQAPLHLGFGEILVTVVYCLELAAVDRHARVTKEVKTPAYQNERAADFANRLAVVLAEIRNGLEVRHQVAGQPHIALALPLKPSARLDAIEISVNVDLQQWRWMIGRPTRCEGRNAVKAELGEIQPIDEDIDHPHRIVLAHIVIQHRGKQGDLLAIRPLNKALHPIPRIRRES
jgi:hypothetical protein